MSFTKEDLDRLLELDRSVVKAKSQIEEWERERKELEAKCDFTREEENAEKSRRSPATQAKVARLPKNREFSPSASWRMPLLAKILETPKRSAYAISEIKSWGIQCTADAQKMRCKSLQKEGLGVYRVDLQAFHPNYAAIVTWLETHGLTVPPEVRSTIELNQLSNLPGFDGVRTSLKDE